VTRPVEVAPDSFLMLRRRALPGGLYDEAMALYFTEDDLCRRLAEGDWRVDFVADARVVHPERTSTSREPPRRIHTIFFDDLHAYYRKFEPTWYAWTLAGLIRLSELLRRARRAA
jgi:GT2 family glycosyltransferase